MKTWIKKVFGFGFASFLSDFSHEMTVSFIPTIVAGFVGSSHAPLILGIIASITDACTSFLRLISGYMSDRISHKKPLIALGYGISATFSTFIGFATSVWQVLLFRVLSFTGSSLREPPRDALISASVESRYYGRSFGLQRAMDTLGALLGPLFAFYCASILALSIPTIFILSFIPGIFAVLAIIFLTKDILIPAKKLRAFTSWREDIQLLPRPYIVLLIVFFIFDLGNINKLLLLARAQEMLSGSIINIASTVVLLYAIFNTTRAASEFLIGLLSDYLNRILLLAFFGFGNLAIVALLLMNSNASIIYCIITFALAGISVAAVTTLKKAIVANVLPAEIRGFGFGALQAAEGFAMLFSSSIIGFLWTHYSIYSAFTYSMILGIVAMIGLINFTFFHRIA